MITNATGILTVSSIAKKRKIPSENIDPAFELVLETCYEDIMLGEMDEMDRYEEHMCAYLALTVEEKFQQNVKHHKYKCIQCAAVLNADENKIDDELLAMKTECKQPTISTFKLIIFANAIMKMYSAERFHGNKFDAVKKTIQENLDIDDIYLNFYDVEHEATVNHKAEFISELIQTYMAIKSRKIGAKITENEQGEYIRRKRKRAVILAGQ